MNQTLINLLCEFFQIDQDNAIDASMQTVDKWDSLSHIELILTLQERFDLPKLKPDEIVEMTNITGIKRVMADKGVVFSDVE